MTVLSIPLVKDFPFQELKNVKCDSFEVRLDYADDSYQKLHQDSIESIKSIAAKQHIPLIFTIRDPAEGGLTPFSATTKIARYQQFTSEDIIVDCELSFYLQHKPLLDLQKVILSKHIPEKSPLDLREAACETIQEFTKVNARLCKLVIPINCYADLDYFLSLPESTEIPILIQGTGLLGKLFRILRILEGQGGNYIALNKKYRTAEAQLTSEELQLYEASKSRVSNSQQLMPINKTVYGGIIGGKQVYQSQGLIHYNQLFTEQGLNAVYLPFPVTDESDFIVWLERFAKKESLYGFSVTMPFKKSIGKLFRVPERPVNLISMPGNKFNGLPFERAECFLNSDTDAFLKAFEKLHVTTNITVLIFGYGATAEMALELTSGFKEVIVTGLNTEKGSGLAQKFNRSFTPIPELDNTAYDLLINCSPVGMNNEDLLELTGSIDFQKAIDLAICKKNTPLINYCLSKDIPCASGNEFWQWQAKRQEQLFLNNIRIIR